MALSAMEFAGYAALFAIPDQGGDIIAPGAFAASLKRRPVPGLPLLFQHDPKEPVGRIVEAAEDETGLRIRGELLVDVSRARELVSLVAGNAIAGLSIGFRTIRARKDADTGYRHLLAIDLWEISIVTFPMMPGARISTLFAPASPPDDDERASAGTANRIAAAISLLSNQ